MKTFLLNATLAFTSMSAAFFYASYYCANSGDGYTADGLAMTFGFPFAFAALIALSCYAATPIQGDEK